MQRIIHKPYSPAVLCFFARICCTSHHTYTYTHYSTAKQPPDDDDDDLNQNIIFVAPAYIFLRCARREPPRMPISYIKAPNRALCETVCYARAMYSICMLCAMCADNKEHNLCRTHHDIASRVELLSLPRIRLSNRIARQYLC